MSRTFYTYAIFFNALSGTLILVQGIIYFLIGPRFVELASTRWWMFILLVITIISLLITVAYLRYRNYQFSLWAAVGVVATSAIQAFSFLKVVQTREITPIFALTTVTAILAGIIFGTSLLFSKAKERYWLRIAGISFVLIGLLGLTIISLALSSLDARLDGTVERLDQWQTIVQCIIPIFLILNFINERSVAKSFSREGGLETIMGLAVLVAFTAAPIVGIKFVNEALWRKRNPDFVWEGARMLAAPFEESSFVGSSGDTIRYRLLMPLDYDSAKRYPLVVCLHGSSGSGHDNIKQVATCLPASWLSNEENRKKYPAILFVPQCPERMTWGGLKGAPSVGALVMETLRSIENDLPIDTTRRYLTGNSMGGYGTWVLAAEYPEYFAAAVPICGGGDPALARQLSQVPIWAFHGEKDMNVPVSGSRDVIDAIKKVGGKPIYSEFPGKAHDISKEVIATPGLLDWLFSQRRTP
jgi:dienelactone hydrolase